MKAILKCSNGNTDVIPRRFKLSHQMHRNCLHRLPNILLTQSIKFSFSVLSFHPGWSLPVHFSAIFRHTEHAFRSRTLRGKIAPLVSFRFSSLSIWRHRHKIPEMNSFGTEKENMSVQDCRSKRTAMRTFDDTSSVVVVGKSRQHTAKNKNERDTECEHRR